MGSGVVGKVGDDEGCCFVLHTKDAVGNDCIRGGEKVEASCDYSSSQPGGRALAKSQADKVSVRCTDLGDGSYRIDLTSEVSGAYMVAVKVHNVHVLGSPATLLMEETGAATAVAAA